MSLEELQNYNCATRGYVIRPVFVFCPYRASTNMERKLEVQGVGIVWDLPAGRTKNQGTVM